jgi:hypothetical protein
MKGVEARDLSARGGTQHPKSRQRLLEVEDIGAGFRKLSDCGLTGILDRAEEEPNE